MSSFDLLAGAVWARAEQWIPDALISVRRGKIVSVRRHPKNASLGKALDFRPWIVLPGFVNAHVHLELTGLALRRPMPGRIETWISELIAQREAGAFPSPDKAAATGIRRCLATGTTALGEIEGVGGGFRALRRSPMRALVFREFLGLDPARALDAIRRAEASLRRSRSSKIELGLSPHAPYSLSPALWDYASRMGRRRVPLSIHLAESAQERELLVRGEGGLARTLRRLRLLPADWKPYGLGPVALLAKYGLLTRRTLLVHGNDLQSRELDLVREAGCSIVFCPGSHRFFRYPTDPLRGALARGIPLALGTDSLASNEDLSMLREMALLHERMPQLRPEAILRMATQGGARALGWEKRIGVLAPGREADFVVLRVEAGPSKEAALEEIVTSQPQAIATFIAGRRALPRSSGVL